MFRPDRPRRHRSHLHRRRRCRFHQASSQQENCSKNFAKDSHKGERKMSTATTAVSLKHKVVSEDQWLAARKELLADEKEFSRQRDALSAKRRGLPCVDIENDYVFVGPHVSQ